MKKSFRIGKNWIIAENHKSLHFSYCTICFPFGSDEDPEGKSGMAHLLEHVLSFSLKRILPVFEFCHSYAVTNHKYIRLLFVIPVEDTVATIYQIVVNLFSDPIDSSYFDKQKLKVVYELLHTKKTDGINAIEQYEALNKGNFLRSPRPTGGIPSEVSSISLEEMENHYIRMIRNKGIVLCIATNSQVLGLIHENTFSMNDKLENQFTGNSEKYVIEGDQKPLVLSQNTYNTFSCIIDEKISMNQFNVLKVLSHIINDAGEDGKIYLVDYSREKRLYYTTKNQTSAEKELRKRILDLSEKDYQKAMRTFWLETSFDIGWSICELNLLFPQEKSAVLELEKWRETAIAETFKKEVLQLLWPGRDDT